MECVTIMSKLNIHVIKTHPYCNLNRDDIGQPKTATFGGVKRTRVSSGCLKHHLRDTVINITNDKIPNARRSRIIVDHVAKKAIAAGVSAEAAQTLAARAYAALTIDDNKKAARFFPESDEKKAKKKTKEEQGSDDKKEDEKGDVLFFMSQHDIDALVDIVVNHKEVLDKLDSARKAVSGLNVITWDIAAFGRMAASNPSLNIEASMCVAHAISANPANEEYDYFSALDELSNIPGGGHVGSNTYTSPILYEYMCFDMEEFLRNMNTGSNEEKTQIARTVITEIIKALALTTPTGKKSNTAPFQPAALILVEEGDLPISYSLAFEKPVSLTEDAVRAFIAHVQKYDDHYGLKTRRWFFNVYDQPLGKTNPISFNTLIADVAAAACPEIKKE
jgi:CRISPR system Cascade subunit CasC